MTKENQFFLPDKMPRECVHRGVDNNELFFGVFLRCAQAAGKTPSEHCQMTGCVSRALCQETYQKFPQSYLKREDNRPVMEL